MWTLVAVLFVALAYGQPRWHQLDAYNFEQYEVDFSKTYQNAQERAFRKALFNKELLRVTKHNKDTSRTWKEGINRFSDWTLAEKKAFNGGIPSHSEDRVQYLEREYDLAALELQAVDWRTKNVITSVKDQGQCGSCWSFGAAETVESYYALATGELAVLSEQQILDCTPNPNHCGGVGGCGGGTAELAFAKIMTVAGLASEWTYPYSSYWGSDAKCQYGARTPAVAAVHNYFKLPPNEYAPVLAHLSTKGPLAINVDASAWSAYEEGVFDGCNQTNPDIDHVVQLVGYGIDEKDGAYWLVRNSWSPSWGEQGYIRLKRVNDQNRCGIDLNPQDGTGCNGGPPTVKVCGVCGILYDTSYVEAGKPK